MTNTATLPACPACGQIGTLTPKADEIKAKKRVKFGIFYVLLTLLFGAGLLLWLITPRRNVVIGVDRYLQCSACGAKV